MLFATRPAACQIGASAPSGASPRPDRPGPRRPRSGASSPRPIAVCGLEGTRISQLHRVAAAPGRLVNEFAHLAEPGGQAECGPPAPFPRFEQVGLAHEIEFEPVEVVACERFDNQAPVVVADLRDERNPTPGQSSPDQLGAAAPTFGRSQCETGGPSCRCSGRRSCAARSRARCRRGGCARRPGRDNRLLADVPSTRYCRTRLSPVLPVIGRRESGRGTAGRRGRRDRSHPKRPARPGRDSWCAGRWCCKAAPSRRCRPSWHVDIAIDRLAGLARANVVIKEKVGGVLVPE